MAHLRDKLTDPQVKYAQPKERPYKLSDGAGMYLFVNPNGGKYWRLKYRFAGKEKVLALGVYPDVKLKDAREKRKKARALLDDHKDPGLAKKEQKRQQKIRAANTFEGVAREWHEKHKHRWTERHSNKVIRSLEQNVFSALGDRPIADITPVELLDVLRVIENRGALELASNVLQRCNAVFRYAIASLRAERNPATDLKGALKPPNPSNYASLSVDDLPEFLEKLDHFRGDKITELAIRLLMLTFVRTKELRMAEWSEFDVENRLWRVPAERMKMGVEHLVPLSDQAIECLKELHEITGHFHLLFPGRSHVNTPMSYNTILFGIYRMGFKGRATGHGFRSTASTILNEMQFPSDAIERQLAHGERDKVRAAYNKAQYMDKRKEMIQAYANFLDALKSADNSVTPIKKKVEKRG